MVVSENCLEGIGYSEYIADVRTNSFRVHTQDNVLYYTRKFTLDPNNETLAERNIKTGLLTTASADDRLIIRSFLANYKAQKENTRQYGSIYDIVYFDEKHYQELATVTTYAKDNMYQIDLSDCVDLALAFMTGVPIAVMRAEIERVCDSHHINYKLFSRAWTTCEDMLQDSVKIEMLYEIHPRLRELCARILHKKQSLERSPILGDCSASDMSDLQLVQVFIQAQILQDIQYMQYTMLKTYASNKLRNADSLVLSKGISSIAISAMAPGRHFDYQLNLGSAGTVIVHSKEYAKGSYLDALLQTTTYTLTD